MPKLGLAGRDANTHLALQFAPCLRPHGLNHAGCKRVEVECRPQATFVHRTMLGRRLESECFLLVKSRRAIDFANLGKNPKTRRLLRATARWPGEVRLQFSQCPVLRSGENLNNMALKFNNKPCGATL
jgi:hypothetical protein